MIEDTDEMISAFGEAWRNAAFNFPGDRRRAGLKAVFAMIERDYEVGPKLCRAARPGNDPDFAYQECEGELGHSGRHYRYPCTEGCEQW